MIKVNPQPLCFCAVVCCFLDGAIQLFQLSENQKRSYYAQEESLLLEV